MFKGVGWQTVVFESWKVRAGDCWALGLGAVGYGLVDLKDGLHVSCLP